MKRNKTNNSQLQEWGRNHSKWSSLLVANNCSHRLTVEWKQTWSTAMSCFQKIAFTQHRFFLELQAMKKQTNRRSKNTPDWMPELKKTMWEILSKKTRGSSWHPPWHYWVNEHFERLYTVNSYSDVGHR